MLDKKIFAERLKKKRHELQLGQAQLAQKVQVAPATISSYELEKCYPDSATLFKLARVFGVSLDWLMGASDKEALEVNETVVFLNALTTFFEKVAIEDYEDEFAIIIKKGTPLADFVADRVFVQSYKGALSDDLKSYIRNNTIEHYSEFSVEDLLKEKTAKRGNA